MDRHFYLNIMIFIAVMALFCQCSKNDSDSTDGYGSEYPRTGEAYSIIDSCMSFMKTDPAKSHHIIDSVCNAGLMSPQRCKYFNATVVFGGDAKPDSALAMCNEILDEGNFGDDIYLEEEVCELASNITIANNRFLETLKYANRGIALCHGHQQMSNDEASLMGRVGEAEQKLGRTKEARETYAKANALLKEDNTFGGLIARISLMMRQASLYSSVSDYDNSIAVSREVLALVEHFDRNPSFVVQRPETMLESGSATRDFADFYESQLYCKIARAYRQKIEQGLSKDVKADRDSINLYMDKWSQTKSHESPINLANAMDELYFTGRKAEFNEAKEVVAGLFKSDSLVSDYAEYLTLLAKDAADHHNYQESNAYLHRALAISDSIRKQETLRTLSEQMSINMVQEQQLARQEAESTAARHKLFNWLLSAIIVLILASGAIIFVLKRKNEEKEEIIKTTQQDLIETKEDLIETKEEMKGLIQKLEETKADRATNSMLALYKRAMMVVKQDKLYLNPDLDIKMLADKLGFSRSSVSTAINTVTGKTFRQWLSEYRLNLFLEKQENSPDVPIDQLLTQCGYKDQSTFRRQFKATFGMKPSEYKRGLKG